KERSYHREEKFVAVLKTRSLLRCAVSVILGAVFVLSSALAQNQPIRVGGNIAEANRISSVTPEYPEEAKSNRIQGTVKLEIMIGEDGHVHQATILSGPTEVGKSAVSAVLQWVYKPTLLNGEPVAVITTVDINYTLAQ